MTTLGKRIEHVRKKMGVNRVELAKKLEISQNLISLYESDKNNPSVETLMKIAYHGDVSLDWLLTGEVNNTISEPGTGYTWDGIKKAEGLWVPIVRTVMAGDPILLYKQEEIIGEIFVPDAKTGYFVVPMQGDSMYNPQNLKSLNDSDYVVIDPSEKPIPGDVALVVVSPNRQLIRQVKNRDQDSITFTAWNLYHADITFPIKEVKTLLRVVALQPKQIKL